jgi:hypothetical protein
LAKVQKFGQVERIVFKTRDIAQLLAIKMGLKLLKWTFPKA